MAKQFSSYLSFRLTCRGSVFVIILKPFLIPLVVICADHGLGNPSLSTDILSCPATVLPPSARVIHLYNVHFVISAPQQTAAPGLCRWRLIY